MKIKAKDVKVGDARVGDRIKWRHPQEWANVVFVLAGHTDRFVELHVGNGCYLHIDRNVEIEVVRA